MKIVAQMDEISSINIKTDSTFAILFEAQNRGHEIYYYVPKTLSFNENRVQANIHKIKLQNKIGAHVEIFEGKLEDVANYDIVLFRQDPPFDMNYITTTYLLEKIKDQTIIVNNPTEIRNCVEKIFVTDFPEFIPPTLITSDLEQIKKFKEKHKEIVIKPIYSCGGDGVFYLKEDDKNINVLTEIMGRLYKTPLIAQKFIKEASKGDKRVLMLNGEILGWVNRVSQSDDIRNNLHLGGASFKTVLTPREELICKKIGVELKKRGLIFVGIDLIGDFVTEINVTSPTCIKEINQVNNSKIEEKIVKYFEGLVN